MATVIYGAPLPPVVDVDRPQDIQTAETFLKKKYPPGIAWGSGASSFLGCCRSVFWAMPSQLAWP